ncbi:uncharacterized protein CFAP97D2 [Grus americana]|uniref:uncharacterized protein CFAP97D2 n=1 Tax=Grus americana TaxID=9117 RepID=UPI0024080619|nr:uncharacterized protein CFAP97D2 [Grus americana]
MCKMHQAYQPILPCGNKYRQLKWDKAKYEEHKKRIQAAKPSVDTSAPAIYSHLHRKLGKLKLEEDRLSVIERDNRLLLEKMSCIMRTKGQIDNKNDYKAKSLNGEKRKQELRRVNQENRTILDRITKSQPQYQVQRWHEDWQRAEKYMANVARYPRGRCKSQSRKEKTIHLDFKALSLSKNNEIMS